MYARCSIGFVALLCGSLNAFADAVGGFNLVWIGRTSFAMRGLNQGARNATDGDSDFFYNAPPRYLANEDHLAQNWWYVRQTVQDLVGGVWVDNGADPREFALGEAGVLQVVAGARTRDYSLQPVPDRRVTLGYDALRPAGAPAGVGPQTIDISYRLLQTGNVDYSFRLGSPTGLGPTRRMLTDFFWLVDIDAHGTPANDRVLAGDGGGFITCVFDDNPLQTAPLFVGAPGPTSPQRFKARVDTRASLLAEMTDAAPTDLAPGLQNVAAGAAGDWAILYQWRIRRGGAARDDDADYEPVSGDYVIEYESDAGLCLGDMNGDRLVSLNDLVVVLANFGRTGGMTMTDGDMDFDGDVDLDDLARMLAVFGRSCD